VTRLNPAEIADPVTRDPENRFHLYLEDCIPETGVPLRMPSSLNCLHELDVLNDKDTLSSISGTGFSALEVSLNDMRCINSRFTYLLTYFCLQLRVSRSRVISRTEE